ncbi:hypothetical protein HAZT_HAZT003335 [Hyalella azteca]|nr:hypothetical protein HAZT_HAZT003335 [Hyalella azteca]
MANIVKAALSVPEELLVFGYSCKLFRDDEKAQFIESGSHLIPWMGDTTMMIDRYDVRGALYDLGAAASSGPPAVLTEVELKEEELCKYERYVALYYDLDVIAEKEEEESKRLQMELAHGTSSFSQVGYSYDGFPMAVPDTADDSSQTSNVPQPALDTVVSVPLQNKPHDKFTPPSSLSLPPGIVVPTSLKQHKIIVKTAGFIAKQGSQMEIILKTKQTGNALFGFMSFDNSLNAYYKHIVGLMKSGRYVEEQQDEDPVEDAPAASFNPSADAAPDAATPSRKVTTFSDCSYSKLISKIKENQAKQANSQASAADAISQQTEKSKASIQSVAQAPLAVPSSPCVQPTAADKTVAPNKPFAGLVDYPSFNQADESDYSYSDSDSHSPVTPAPQNGDIQPKVTKNKDKSCLGKRNSSLKKDGEVSNVIDSYDAVKWPSNRDQMVIDKIACYIVKNGSRFEQTIKSRGDPRFDFLKTGNDYNKYFELKKSLFAEIFGEHLSKSASKRSESTRDMKTVIAASKSMAGSDCVSSPPTISFKLKQRKDQEVTLPPTSFPLESSSSEEDLENLDAEEQQKRQELRQERRRWRQMKREQFEQEKKERKLREEELEKKRAEEAKRAAMKNYDEYERPKAMQEDEENSSADEEMYDIFKYAQENRGADEYGDSCDAQEAAAAPAKPSEKRRKRKAAAHAFISKLKVDPANPPAPPMIGPQLPPEIAALMMAATTSPPPPPSPLPSSPTLSPRPASSCPPSSPPSPRTPQPLSKDHSPSMDRSRSPAAVVSEPAEDGLISTAHDDTVSQAAPLCT